MSQMAFIDLTGFEQNVPPFVVVAGNPARILRKIESELAMEYFKEHPEEEVFPQSK